MGGNVASRNSTEMNEHKQDSHAHCSDSITHNNDSLSNVLVELLGRATLGSVIHCANIGEAGIYLKSSARSGVIKSYLITSKGTPTYQMPTVFYHIGSSIKKARMIGSGLTLAQSSGGKMAAVGGWTPSIEASYESNFVLSFYERSGNLIAVLAPFLPVLHLLYYAYVNLTIECGLLPGEEVKLSTNTTSEDFTFTVIEV